ncbi:MAG: hypothetical protein LWX55_16550, partial [Deltaproteobacteria bacterium]|nr:hypothetical protein [Deltaproteobacteria bacterium]
MTEKFTIALFSFIGILVTVVVSYVTSRLNAKYTIRKLHGELGGKLYEEKLAVYPEIYRTLSEFIKKQVEDDWQLAGLNEFKAKVDKLDSENGILFNAITVEEFWELRKYINSVTILSDEEFDKWKTE